MIKKVMEDYKVLLRSIPAATVSLFFVSVIMMNLLANKELNATIGGTWYVVLGSSLAMLVSAVVNSTLNQSLGRMLKKNNFASFAFRSYVSTGVGQFIDNLVFAIVVSHTFFGWTWVQVLMCSLTGAVAELLCEF